MKRIFIFCLLFIMFVPQQSIFCQEDSLIMIEINKDVWEPFIIAFNNNYAQDFIDLHSDDVLRVTPWGIKEGKAFKVSTFEKLSKENAPKRRISFKFEHRLHKKLVAYEVGYYKIDVTGKDGEIKNYYGRFHIVLKKINGSWKITQDWDTSNINGVSITEEDYERLN